MALQTAAAPKLPGNLQTCVAKLGVAGVEQPELGDSAVVSLLAIEPTWLGNVYGEQQLATDREMANLLSLAKGDSLKYCIQ